MMLAFLAVLAAQP